MAGRRPAGPGQRPLDRRPVALEDASTRPSAGFGTNRTRRRIRPSACTPAEADALHPAGNEARADRSEPLTAAGLTEERRPAAEEIRPTGPAAAGQGSPPGRRRGGGLVVARRPKRSTTGRRARDDPRSAPLPQVDGTPGGAGPNLLPTGSPGGRSGRASTGPRRSRCSRCGHEPLVHQQQLQRLRPGQAPRARRRPARRQRVGPRWASAAGRRGNPRSPGRSGCHEQLAEGPGSTKRSPARPTDPARLGLWRASGHSGRQQQLARHPQVDDGVRRRRRGAREELADPTPRPAWRRAAARPVLGRLARTVRAPSRKAVTFGPSPPANPRRTTSTQGAPDRRPPGSRLGFPRLMDRRGRGRASAASAAPPPRFGLALPKPLPCHPGRRCSAASSTRPRPAFGASPGGRRWH